MVSDPLIAVGERIFSSQLVFFLVTTACLLNDGIKKASASETIEEAALVACLVVVVTPLPLKGHLVSRSLLIARYLNFL
jgi:hypothetical protein